MATSAESKPQRGPLGNAFNEANYHWSNFSWRIGLGLTALAAALGSGAGVAVGAIGYWWDRRTIRNYKAEKGISLEPRKFFWDFPDPNKGSQRDWNPKLA